MGGSGGQTNTVTKSDPWAGQQPYLQQGFAEAQKNFQSGGPQYYNGSTVANQSQNTQNAYKQMAQQTQNNPLQNASQDQVSKTLNGDYLNGNPFLDAQFQAGTQGITKAYNDAVGGQTSGAELNGRYGSGMQAFQKGQAQQNLMGGLNNLYANTYGQNYQQERANQVNAVGQAAGVQNQGITNANALGQVGSAQDQYAQSLTDADVAKWNYNQNLANNNLGQYMGLIQGNYGGSQSTQTPMSGQNNLGLGLGLGMSALGAYGAMK